MGLADRRARAAYLREWAERLTRAAYTGSLAKTAIELHSVHAIPGYRTGVLEVQAGKEAGVLLRALSANSGAMLRQTVPWSIEGIGAPSVKMDGRLIRLEAPWPTGIERVDVSFGALTARETASNRWVAGVDEDTGWPVSIGFTDDTPHWLFGGSTGSGKTTALRCACLQLATRENVRLVLVDAKGGRGLGALQAIPGVLGPVARDAHEASRVFSWLGQEIRERSKGKVGEQRLVVVVDELGELVQNSRDEGLVRHVEQIVTLGRELNVSLIAGLQDPTSSVLRSQTIARNMSGRLVLRTTDYNASAAIVGASKPRADLLFGGGDAWIVVPGATVRTQLALVDDADIRRISGHQPVLDAWPDTDYRLVEQMNQAVDESLAPEEAPGSAYSDLDVALSLVAAAQSNGRPALQQMLTDNGRPRYGSAKADRLLTWGRRILGELALLGYGLTAGELAEDDWDIDSRADWWSAGGGSH